MSTLSYHLPEFAIGAGVRSVSGWESEQMQFGVPSEPRWVVASVTSAAEAIRSITR